MSPEKMEGIIVLVERGKLTANYCIFSLACLVKSCNTTIPALWIEKDGVLAMNDS